MKPGRAERARLEREVESRRGLGRSSCSDRSRGELSLASDIDLPVLSDEEGPAGELTREVYRRLDRSEAVDVLAYSVKSWERIKDRPFFPAYSKLRQSALRKT